MQNGNASLTQSCSMLPIISNAQNPLHTFPCNFPRTWGSRHVVADLLATYWHVKIVCHVASKSATSWQQVVVMEFWKQHYTTDTTNFCSRQLVPTCCGLATGKLWETGVMDFGLSKPYICYTIIIGHVSYTHILAICTLHHCMQIYIKLVIYVVNYTKFAAMTTMLSGQQPDNKNFRASRWWPGTWVLSRIPGYLFQALMRTVHVDTVMATTPAHVWHCLPAQRPLISLLTELDIIEYRVRVI